MVPEVLGYLLMSRIAVPRRMNFEMSGSGFKGIFTLPNRCRKSRVLFADHIEARVEAAPYRAIFSFAPG